MKGSSADKAGIKPKDIITSIDSTKITTASALQEKVNSFHPGDIATFTLIREDKVKKVEVAFQGEILSTGTVDVDGSIAFYGAKLITASKETLARFGLKKGVEVVSVGQGKMLDAGASEGFIIQYVNDEPVSKAEDVVALAKKSKRGVYIAGVSASGRSSFFAFGKDE